MAHQRQGGRATARRAGTQPDPHAQDWAKAGAQIVGLDTEGAVSLDEYDGTGPTVIVVGSEGKGLSRPVRETCDSVLAIPMAGDVESLNASVAAGVVLADFARQRRQSQ